MRTELRVLVCGGRFFGKELSEVHALHDALENLHKSTGIAVLIHGDAPGADRLAGEWAKINRVPIEVYAAAWTEHGKAAGPIRNQRMLNEGRPDLVLACAGGRGTRNMIALAEAQGVPVEKVDWG